jgi:hypothetical protein
MAKKTRWRPPLSLKPCAPPLPYIYPNDGVAFWLVVASSHAAGAIEIRGPIALSIFIFFVPQFATRNDGQTSSPTRSARSNRLSEAPPPPKPSFGWLSRLIFKWRPPKTGAPPITQFVDGRHFGAPNKGIERSAREPGRRAPLLGSRGGAARRLRSMADVAMERECKAAGGRVAAAHRVVCVLCV